MRAQRTRIYLDHSATTPIDPAVADAMRSALTDAFGNPSSIHGYGRDARQLVEDARESVASLINAEPEEIYFTSGGTEADNWALRGIAHAYSGRGNRIITSEAEHPAVLDTCRQLESDGYVVEYLPTDTHGIVHPHDLETAINDETILISLMHANNEIGSIHPIWKYARTARERGVLFHTDAVQAFGKLPIDVEFLQVDLLSLSAHKIYGPKGVGALYVRRGVNISPLMHGGHHERDRRGGTENVSGIVGLGAAARLRTERMEADNKHLAHLAELFMDAVTSASDGITLNGHPTNRLRGHLSLSFEGVDGEALLMNLDRHGIAASSGAACTSGAIEPSHVLTAIGLSPEEANSTIRFTFGRGNTQADVEYAAEIVVREVKRLRGVSSKNLAVSA